MHILPDQQIYSTTPGLSKVEILQQLERALLWVAITVDVGEGRFITNQAMLQQLNMMREEMYRGNYLLDKFRYLQHEERNVNDHRNRSLVQSVPNPGKCSPPSHTSKHGTKELKLMLDSVQNMVTDMFELVAFLKNYPPLHRQPYTMYLLLEKCMFGRQAEMERAVYFLLQKEPIGEYNLGVLPIVGQGKVGKSTLVEHVSCDVRVRSHFSQIVFFSGNKLREEKLCTLMDGGIIKHKSNTENEGKILVVVELDGETDVSSWRRLLSDRHSCIPSGSKIIITSQSEKIIKLGTTEILRLNFLAREACWYFFKVLVLGSTYPEDQPKLVSIAMEIFEEYYSNNDVLRELTGSFANSKNIAGLLKANATTKHWRRILSCVKGTVQRNQLPFSTDPSDTWVENRQFYISRICNISQYCLVDRQHRVGYDNEEVPKIFIDQIQSGSITPLGKFEVVLWKSHLPPYYCYITSCDIHDSKFMQDGKKFCKKRKDLS